MHCWNSTDMSQRRANRTEPKKLQMVQSKVSAATLSRLDAIVSKYGFSARYELVQFLISAFLRYADPEHESGVSKREEMLSEIGRIFAGYDDPERRINIARQSELDTLPLTDTFFVYGTGKSAVIKHMRCADSGTLCSCGISSVLEAVLPGLLPEEAGYLKTVAAELGSDSLLVALRYLIEADRRCGEYKPDDYASNEYGRVPVRKQNRKPF